MEEEIHNRTGQIQALVSAAVERWPVFELKRKVLEERVFVASQSNEMDGIRPDFVLACALVDGEPDAYQVFEHEFMPPLMRALGRAGIDQDLVEDALQVVRFRLLVETDSKPARIVSYRGRSSLGRWLYVVALREARSLAGRARTRPMSDVEVAEQTVSREGDLESAYLATEHKAAFTRALEKAIQTLSAKERLLLRLDVLEGLKDREIAKIYDVHRTTALRWIDQATNRLIKEAKRFVSEELSLEGSELDSLMRALASRFDLSLGRLLAQTPSPDIASMDKGQAKLTSAS